MSMTASKSGKKLSTKTEQMIRVDHAGEYGADRIYAGQAAILGADLSTKEKRHTHDLVNHMWEQEKEHLRTFENKLTHTHVANSQAKHRWKDRRGPSRTGRRPDPYTSG